MTYIYHNINILLKINSVKNNNPMASLLEYLSTDNILVILAEISDFYDICAISLTCKKPI